MYLLSIVTGFLLLILSAEFLERGGSRLAGAACMLASRNDVEPLGARIGRRAVGKPELRRHTS